MYGSTQNSWWIHWFQCYFSNYPPMDKCWTLSLPKTRHLNFVLQNPIPWPQFPFLPISWPFYYPIAALWPWPRLSSLVYISYHLSVPPGENPWSITPSNPYPLSPSTVPACKALTLDQFKHQYTLFPVKATKNCWSEINMSKTCLKDLLGDIFWSIYGWNGMMPFFASKNALGWKGGGDSGQGWR